MDKIDCICDKILAFFDKNPDAFLSGQNLFKKTGIKQDDYVIFSIMTALMRLCDQGLIEKKVKINSPNGGELLGSIFDSISPDDLPVILNDKDGMKYHIDDCLVEFIFIKGYSEKRVIENGK